MVLVRILFLALGTFSLILGVIGIFLPLLPTTPFLLLTAFLYFRSSPKAYEWLLRQPYLGKYIRDYRENEIIPLRAKIISLSIMWTSIIYCILFLVLNVWGRAGLVLISLAVTYHILLFKSK